jgi:hypothetical protein
LDLGAMKKQRKRELIHRRTFKEEKGKGIKRKKKERNQRK